jgi:ribosomal protein L7/L12
MKGNLWLVVGVLFLGLVISLGIWKAGFDTWLVMTSVLLAVVIVVRVSDQVSRLELKLDAILGSLGVNLAELADREVRALLRANQKIQAIRVYRTFTATSLAAAKAHVERLQQDLHESVESQTASEEQA